MYVSSRKKMLVVLVCLTLASVLVFAGCQRQEPTQPAKGDVSGSISISGSTSVQPLVQDLAHIFYDKYPNITVDVQGGGSSNGVRSPYEGTSDIGMSSRDLKPEEKEWGLTEHIIALDGIAVIVNKSNSVSGLTKEQIKQIYTGEIANWNEVGGVDQEILVVSREAGSGTRGAFEDIVGFENLIEDALIGNGTGAIKAHVADKENAIGYISLGALDDNTRSLLVDGVSPTADNVKSGSYPVSRPFIMLTRGEMNAAAAKFMEFIFSDSGQQIVKDSGFIDIR